MYRLCLMCMTSVCVAAFQLPKLDYGYADLAPNITKQIMQLHHSKHHQGYVDALNDTLSQPGYKAYQQWSLSDLLVYISHIPAAIRPDVQFYAGGHANHAFFWRIMKPPRVKMEAHGNLLEAIRNTFGSLAVFKETFNQKASSIRGSGWAWLVLTMDNQLAVRATNNQDSPLMQGEIPILGIDVWEHAYYLAYLNDRKAYITNWWDLVNWDFAERLYTAHIENKSSARTWFETVMGLTHIQDAYQPEQGSGSSHGKARHNGRKTNAAPAA